MSTDPYQPRYPNQTPQGAYPSRPNYGPPQPPWQSPPPRRKGKTGWIVGGIAAAITLLVVLAFSGCSALAQGINGGGGSQAEKASEMMTRADNLPEGDWAEVFRNNPKVDPGCLSIDTSCLRLSARWSVDHKVSLEEAADRFGMKSNSDGPVSGRYEGCIRTQSGSARESLCIEESAEGPDSYEVTIQMERD